MTKNATILTLILGLFFLTSYAQNSKPKPADKFLEFLNNYQTDSLQVLVADNFQLKRTFSTYTNDKKSFVEKYVPYSKNVNGKFKIIKTTYNKETTDFLVEDQTDYFKLLKIDYPKWKLQIVTNKQGKIERMTIDTTENYQTYVKQHKQKSAKFDSWLKQKYPKETNEILYYTTGLLKKRLKEYSIK